MADYYPLISRAVTGLEKNTGEQRRAVYERARNALLTQLRSLEPALPESYITRERLALEESIRKVEAESARRFIDTVRQGRVQSEPRRETPARFEQTSRPAPGPAPAPAPPAFARHDAVRTAYSPLPAAPAPAPDLFAQP